MDRMPLEFALKEITMKKEEEVDELVKQKHKQEQRAKARARAAAAATNTAIVDEFVTTGA